MENLNMELEEVVVAIEDILLDANNPRFFDQKQRKVGETRICEEGVQNDTARRMREFGLDDLKNSISSNGFLILDRVVVRPSKCDSGAKFIVVEGNRRIASAKELLSECEAGEIDLVKEVLSSIKNIPVLVYRGKEKQISWILQGIRHVQGIRGWGGYQQAKLLVDQLDDPSDLESLPAIAKRFGIDTRIATRLVESHHAFSQVSEEPRFKDKLEPRKFAIFSEAIFLPGRGGDLRKWLGWSEEKLKFENDDAVESLATLVLPNEDGGDPKVGRAIDLRDQVSRLVDPDMPGGVQLLSRLVTDPEYTLDSAMVDWRRMHDRGKPEREMEVIIQEILDFSERIDAPIMRVPDKAPELKEALVTLSKKIKLLSDLIDRIVEQ